MLEINIKRYLKITHIFSNSMWHLPREISDLVIESLDKVRLEKKKNPQRVIAEFSFEFSTQTTSDAISITFMMPALHWLNYLWLLLQHEIELDTASPLVFTLMLKGMFSVLHSLWFGCWRAFIDFFFKLMRFFPIERSS